MLYLLITSKNREPRSKHLVPQQWSWVVCIHWCWSIVGSGLFHSGLRGNVHSWPQVLVRRARTRGLDHSLAWQPGLRTGGRQPILASGRRPASITPAHAPVRVTKNDWKIIKKTVFLFCFESYYEWLLCSTCMSVCFVDVVRQLLFQLVYCLLLLMVHAHHCYPYLTTTMPKTTTCCRKQRHVSKFFVLWWFCLKVASCQKNAFSRTKTAGIGQKTFRWPASSGQNASWW